MVTKSRHEKFCQRSVPLTQKSQDTMETLTYSQLQTAYLKKSKELEVLKEKRKQQKKINNDIHFLRRQEEDTKLLLETVSAFLKRARASVLSKLEGIVNQTMEVFSDKHKLSVKLVVNTRRNRPVLDIVLFTDDKEVSLDGGAGDGLREAMSFTFRVAMWKLGFSKARPFFVMDEPFIHVSHSNASHMMQFVKSVANMFHTKFLIITHNPSFAEQADLVCDGYDGFKLKGGKEKGGG